MKLKEARKFIRQESGRWGLKPPKVLLSISPCFSYDVDPPHRPTVVLTENSTWDTVAHELAHYFTYIKLEHTYHGQDHELFMQDILFDLD